MSHSQGITKVYQCRAHRNPVQMSESASDKRPADVIGGEAASMSYADKLRIAQSIVQRLREAGIECELGGHLH